MPGRARHAPAAGVRHRAGRPAARLRAGRPRRDRRGGARPARWRRATRRPTGRPGRCPSPGCATPPSTSRCSSSCATRSPAELDEQGKRDWAARGVRGDRRRAAAAAARRPVAAHVGSAPGPQAPPAGGRAQPVGAPRRGGPPARHRPRPGAARTRRSSAAALALPTHRGRPGRAAGAGAAGRLRRQTATWLPADRARPWTCPDAELPELKTPHEGPPPARSWTDREPVAAARLAAARAAVARDRRRAPAAGREPARARRRAPGCAGSHRAAHAVLGGGGRLPARPRSPRLAGRPHRPRPVPGPGPGRPPRRGRPAAAPALAAAAAPRPPAPAGS